MLSNEKEICIKVENVSKAYPIFKKPIDRLKQMIYRKHKTFYETFWALKDINLEVYKGETLGILGKNGSGKSTLLQIIAGTLRATSGNIETHGRIAALLELGAGFNPEFTGEENIVLSGAILGISENEMKSLYPKIVEFADIGNFVKQPVKTYSSGMFARLAFSVASSVSPQILIVDEILAVGDAKFQARCFARLKELKEQGTTIILVTHSPEQVVQHCTRAILLNDGHLLEDGVPRDVVNKYLDLLFGKERKEKKQEIIKEEIVKKETNSETNTNFKKDLSLKNSFSERQNYNQYEYHWGNGEAEILDYCLKFNGDEYPLEVKGKGKLEVIIKCVFYTKVIRPIFGFTVKTKEGTTVYGTNSELKNIELPNDIEVNKPIFVSFSCDLNLSSGDYFLSLGLAKMDSGEVVPLDRRYDSIYLKVLDKQEYFGAFDLSVDIKILK